MARVVARIHVCLTSAAFNNLVNGKFDWITFSPVRGSITSPYMSSKMRRSFNNHTYQPLPTSSKERTNVIEEQNEELTEALGDKVHMLKSLTIDLGHEVKEHNKFLSGLDEDFERTGGFLSKTLNRVVRLGKGSHNYYILYLFLFSVLVFFIIWILIK